MKKLLLLFVVLFLSTELFAKSYKIEVKKSDDKDNKVEVENEDGISTVLKDGEYMVEETDTIITRGDGYVIFYVDPANKVLIRKMIKKVSDIIK